MKYLFIVFITTALISCSNGNESSVESSDNTISEKYFPGFPGLHFQNVVLGSGFTMAHKTLEDNSYVPKPDQPNHFVSETFSTEVVFTEDDDLITEFKVFFFDADDLKKVDEFKAFFSQHAVEEFPSPEFCIYTFDSISQKFTISLFEQPDFIRLHYELKTAP